MRSPGTRSSTSSSVRPARSCRGNPDTTQDADLFIEKTVEHGRALAEALRELGFRIGDAEAADIIGGRALMPLRNGPLDIDLVFAPDGIACYEDARRRGVQVHGYRVCSMEDIIESKRASNRVKDRESLRTLRDYAVYLEHEPHPQMRPLPPRWRGHRPRAATDR